MKHVVMTGAGGPEVLRFEEAPIPEPGPHEVLIEVHAAGVNRPDIAQRQGRYPPPPGASPILGLEVAGIISKAGSKAGTDSRFRPGDRVCALVPGGGYAQYCIAPASHCLPVPRGISMLEAAGIPETYFTVWANVFQAGKLQAGERFLVHGGTSGIGTTAIQLAKAFGAEVFATAGTREKCDACLKLGADHAIQYKEEAFEKRILELTQGAGVNLILDMVGGEYTARNLECLAGLGRGRIVQIATQRGAEATLNLMKLMQKRAVITGSTLRPRSVEEKAAIASELQAEVWPLLEKRRVRVIVDRVFPFADVSQAHAYLEAGSNIGKVILQLRGD